MAVVAGHALRDLDTPFFQPSYLAVDFFFVLSGYVLARTYEDKFAAGLSLVAYMQRRLRRLYPAIIVGLVMGLAVALAHGANDKVWIAAVLQSLMLPRFTGAMFPFNDVQWSLMFELLANAVHALIHRWLTNTVLIVVVAGAAIALWALSLGRGTMNGGFDVLTLDIGLARVMFSFFAGVAIHRFVARITLPPLSFLPAALVLGLALAIPATALAPAVLTDLAIATFLWPALVLAVVKGPQPVRLAAFADWSGRISYPLYAVHYPVVVLLAPWLPAAPAFVVGLVLALSLALAVLVERYVERPILARGSSAAPRPAPVG